MRQHPSRRSNRRTRFEPLEERRLLAADPFGTNQLQPLDVSRDGQVSALDALQVINALGRSSQPGIADPTANPGTFVDVNNDGSGTPLDALMVINALGRKGAIIAATLPVDSAPIGDADLGFDLLTNDYAINLNVSIGGVENTLVTISIDGGQAEDITDAFSDNRAHLSKENIDAIFGGPLSDGDHPVVIQFGDNPANRLEFVLTVDREVPELVDVYPKRSVLVGDRSVEVEMGTSVDELFLDSEAVVLIDTSDSSKQFRPSSITPHSESSTLRFNFDQDVPAGDYELVVDQARISTPAGNAVGSDTVRAPLRFLRATAIWDNPEGGSWDDPENWKLGRVPGEFDAVLIDVPEGVVVEGPAAAVTTIEHLALHGILESRSNIQARTISVERGVLRINSGGSVSDVLYTSRTGLGAVSAVQMNVENVVFDLPVGLDAGNSLRVTGGLEINHELRIAGVPTNSVPAEVTFVDGQDVTGRGKIVFAGSGTDLNKITAAGSGVVKFADTLTIVGSDATISGSTTNRIDLEARVFDDGRDGDRKILLKNLGSSDSVLALNLDTPEGLVQIDAPSDHVILNRRTSPLEFNSSVPLQRVILRSPSLVTSHLSFQDQVTLESDMTIRSVAGALSRINLLGSVNVDGFGDIVFDGQPTDEFSQRIETGSVTGQPLPQTASIGPGITIRGNAGLLRTRSGVAFDFSGTIIGGPDSNFVLNDVGSVEGFKIDSPWGTVKLDDIQPSKIFGVGDSFVRISDSQVWTTMQLFVPVRIEAGAHLELKGGATINRLITLEGNDLEQAVLELTDGEPFTGNGGVFFAGLASRPYGNYFKADLRGETLDSNLSVGGYNGIFGGSARYNGRISAYDGGTIAVGMIDGGGEAITIGSSGGKVLLYEISNAILNSAGSGDVMVQQFADLGFTSPNTGIDEVSIPKFTNVSLNVPLTVLGSTLFVLESLTVNSTIVLEGREDEVSRLDQRFNSKIIVQDSTDNAATINGTGSILFGDAITTADEHSLVSSNFHNLTIGPEIMLGGKSGRISTGSAQITHQGSIVTDADAVIKLYDVVTRSGELKLEPQNGRVFIARVPENITITGTEGAVAYTEELLLVDATVDIPLVVTKIDLNDGIAVSGISVNGDLTLNSTLRLFAEGTGISFSDPGVPSVDAISYLNGTGTVIMVQFDPDPNDGIGVSSHYITGFDSLTIGAGITIQAGRGVIRVNDSREDLRILGTIEDFNSQLTIGPLADD
ncbi:dockerin type I domain-containing protein [Rubripirellula reticaptiva]|uniref:Dockerin type I repeat protein n=1 Tax=Rubripirellula reticaptiva TaxID=2528013 RepID=A0A5C6FCJ1_9BACT|nr:dockerin type I domain-containing protein [Rubripirellula reticaptiva]TWU58024.1 Dockerin type I repeat protein [Rubripirellula reticaptiva]